MNRPPCRRRRTEVSRRTGVWRHVAAVLIVAFVGGCSGPFVLVPGGELEGEEAPIPADWAFTDDVSTIQIETRPEDPYSVNIWVVALGPALYLHAGANRTAWVEHLEQDPRLRVRVEEKLYALRAARVEDAAEFARFADAYEAKYGTRPRNENVSEVFLIRLEPRDERT